MNSLGALFKVTSFGESHGEYVGCVIDGCPAGLLLDLEKIQHEIDRRKTAQQSYTSTRQEDDQLEIVSGVFEGKTLGSPICILIKNKDAKSSDYDQLKNVYRPGHADFTTQQKYGFRDHRGGGRSSIRITAPLVAAGEIALQLIRQYYPIHIVSYVSQIGHVLCEKNYKLLDLSLVDDSPVRCPEIDASNRMLDLIDQVKKEGDTLGGMITSIIQQIPVGIGEPIFGKLQAQLAHAMMSINTAKGFEYGDGFASVSQKGSETNDSFIKTNLGVETNSNHSGGILGGISNGMDIYFNVAFKPISSIRQEQQTLNINQETTTLQVGGRHDVCAVPRAVPIVEAYTAIVLAGLLLQFKTNQL